jgi:integrase
MIVDQWLETLRSKNTKIVYRAGLRNFARVIGFDLEDYVAKVQGGRDPFDDLLKYATSLAGSPPKTVSTYFHGILNFLEYAFDFELSKKQRRHLRNRLPKGKRARTVEDDLTREKLRRILTHCDAKGRALFLLLESSGIRIGEVLQLELDDIDLTSEPPKVNVRGEYSKTGDRYYSFMSSEAKEALTEWIKERDNYLKVAAKRGKGLAKFKGDGRGVKSVDDDRIFPFSSTVATGMWNRALKKAGLENRDKGTHRRTMHVHMLRKYFDSQMRLTVPRAIVEALMGHEEGSDDAYRRYTEKQIREEYLKGEPHLYVFSTEEMRQLRTRYDSKMQQFAEDYLAMRQTIKKLETRVKELGEAYTKNLSREVQRVVDDLYGEDLESRQDLARAREEFTRQQREEHQPPVTEEKAAPPPTEEKTMTDSLHAFYKWL